MSGVDRTIERGHATAGDRRAVLFVQFTAEPSGSPLSGLLIAKALRARGWAVDAVFGRPGSCAALYEAAGCAVHDLPHGSWLTADRWFRQILRWRSEWSAARRFSRLMRDRRPDLVYVNNITGVAAALAARWHGIPCVWHLREQFQDVGGDVRDPPLGGRAVVRLALDRLAAHVVAVSHAVRKNVFGDRPAPRVTVVPNAAFAEFFHERRSPDECRRLLGLPLGVPIIGMPGALRPMKGHGFFLEAARLANVRHPDARFAITGSGRPAYRTQLEESIAGTPLANRVHFLGTVTDMAAFYRACDVICVPSQADSCPRTAIEPLAIGTPVIGSDVGGISETLDHGRTGLLVPYGDAAALGTAFERLLDDPRERARLAVAARSRAEAEYREELYCDRILGIIDASLCREGRNPWGGPSFWVAVVILFTLLLAVPASQCRWTVDDPYMLPFANTTLRDAYAQWMPLWGFERLQTPLLCHLQYPLGEGLCHLLRAVVHLACAAFYGVLLVRLGWGRAVAASTALLYVILPFQIEPVLLPNFQSLLSQPAILVALLCFIRGAAVGANTNLLWWSLSLGLAFVATLGHGSYLFAPLLVLTLPFCPARRGWRSPPAMTLVAAAACALVPIAVSVLLHVVHRYPLRGEPTVVAFPKIVFAMQYRCLMWMATNLWHAVTHPQVPALLAQAAVLLPAAVLVTRGLAAAARAEDTVAGPPSRGRLAWFAGWAYAWILVGYSVYFLTGGATGTARQNYVASMGIAGCLGLLVTQLVRTRLGKPLVAAGIGLTCLGTLGIGWEYVRWTKEVSACIAGREHNPAVPTFVDLYTACAREAWAAAAPARRSLSYDVYNVRNWVVTGFTGFLPRTDPRPLETQMARKLVEAFALAWPSLDDAARRRIARDVDRRLASVEPRAGPPAPAADPGSEQDGLASLTKRTETLFDRLQARSPIVATPP